nr:MAG TPA: hypothetical protein [Crassvirales sp.]DAH40581.1 MAG TPA: hypothetical protein [Caudoviricetes sp.]
MSIYFIRNSLISLYRWYLIFYIHLCCNFYYF